MLKRAKTHFKNDRKRRKTLDMRVVFLLILNSLATIGFAQTVSSKKSLKAQKKTEAFTLSSDLADLAELEFVATFASPSTGGNVMLTGPTYNLVVKGDSLDVFLPYFGVTRIAMGDLGSDRGIKFKGVLSDYAVGKNLKKQRVVVTFKAQADNQETYRFTLYMGGGEDASLNVSSVYRDAISFSGNRFKLE